MVSESLELDRCYGWHDESKTCENSQIVIGQTLVGGKGGFGAMLRSMGKSGCGVTQDFGACRDLSGRRLRHVNDDIALERWHKARTRNEVRKHAGIVETPLEEFTPADGIKEWHLTVPAWAELPKAPRSKVKTRQDARKRQWQDEEADILASGCTTRKFTGTVTMVDSVHEGFCIVNSDVYVPIFTNVRAGEGDDWDGYGSAPKLRIGDELRVSAALRPHGRNKWNAYKSERVSFAATGKVRKGREKYIGKQVRQPKYIIDQKEFRLRKNDVELDRGVVLSGVNSNSIRDSVSTGLIAIDRSKKQKHRGDTKQITKFLAVQSGVCASARSSFLGMLSGNARISRKGVAFGLSEFCSVAIASCKPLMNGKWYYEAKMLTDGVVQLGWANSFFRGDDAKGDGIGDDLHSWAFDGCRKVKWSDGIKNTYGGAVAWKRGDVIGCLLNMDLGQISFTRNGHDLGVAFQNLPHFHNGLFAALSLEDNEAVELIISQEDMRFSPPLGYEPLETASLIPTLADHSDKHIANETYLVNSSTGPIEIQEIESLNSLGASSLSPQFPARTSSPPKSDVIVNRINHTPVVPLELDLSSFETMSALKELGLDRLKAALLAIGAKCGGTLEDRASRLFSTKGRDRSDWDSGVFAKPSKK